MEYPNGSLHTVIQPAWTLPNGMLFIVLKIAGLTKFGYLWTNVAHLFPTNPLYIGSRSHRCPHALAKWRWFSAMWFLTRHMCWGLANWWVKQQVTGEATPSSIWRWHWLAVSCFWLLVFIMTHSIFGSFLLNLAETVKRVQNLPENKEMDSKCNSISLREQDKNVVCSEPSYMYFLSLGISMLALNFPLLGFPL